MGGLDSSSCLKERILKTFIWEFSKTFKTAVFPEISSVVLLKSDSVIDTLAAILKILGTFALNSAFNIVMGGWFDNSNHLKGMERCFFGGGIFQNFQNSSISEHPLKNG